MKITLLEQFFPHRCRICHRIVPSMEQIVCVPCFGQLPFNHWDIGDETYIYKQINDLIPIEGASALLRFKRKNSVQTLLHELKFFNQPQIGKFLGKLAAQELKTHSFNSIIPIPVHKRTLRKRNYNQVYTFAQTLSEKLQIPLLEENLIRKKRKKTQIFKDRRHRLLQLENSFYFKPYSGLKENHNILLVDDLCTTGATLRNCILAIKQNANPKIWVYTMAAVY